MKHYTAEKFSEFVAFCESTPSKRVQRRARSAMRTSYRRRERAALKRMLSAEVEDELAA